MPTHAGAAVLVDMGEEDVADPVLVVLVLVAETTHCVAVPGAATLKVVTLHDDVRAEKPWDSSVLEASGISSCVLIMDSAHPSHMAFDAGFAVLIWLAGLMPASFAITELHL